MTESRVYHRDGGDPRMLEASRCARESFGVFWREMSWERRRIIPGTRLAAVKAPFQVREPEPGVPTAEHMWVQDLAFDGRVVAGTLLNTAGHIPGLVAGTPVTVPWEAVGDWMYVAHDLTVCGGFTVQATRAGMSIAARADHDRAWGLEFLDPDLVALVPEQRAGLPFEVAHAQARAAEHPMSVSSTDAIAQQLAGDPAAARTVLDDGLSLLHVDALGGNLGPVQALLRFGADPGARTRHGDTALDLAERMGWPRVATALGG